jgi:DNA-binding LacI/PurR family transcriptional regulator
LTTIRQLLFESGQLGVELLLQALDRPVKEPVCEILPTDLIIRQTTARINS